MKNIFKNKFLVIGFLLIAISFIFSSKTMAASKDNYIFIGDSRTVQMATAKGVTKFSESNSKVNTSITINNRRVHFIGKVSVGYSYWFENSSHYAEIKKALKTANSNKNGCKCIIWLGVNDCLYNNIESKYATAINKLAETYKNVDFYCFSVTSVNRTYYKGVVKNTDIQNFNKNLKKKLQAKSRYGKNLKYVNIYSDNVTISNKTQGLNKWITTTNKYLSGKTDGLHYNSTLYKKIYNLMISKTK